MEDLSTASLGMGRNEARLDTELNQVDGQCICGKPEHLERNMKAIL